MFSLLPSIIDVHISTIFIMSNATTEIDRAVVAFMPKIFFILFQYLVFLVTTRGLRDYVLKVHSLKYVCLATNRTSRYKIRKLSGGQSRWLQFQREFPITKKKFTETAFDFLPS